MSAIAICQVRVLLPVLSLGTQLGQDFIFVPSGSNRGTVRPSQAIGGLYEKFPRLPDASSREKMVNDLLRSVLRVVHLALPKS
jgi:hypothetical protein